MSLRTVRGSEGPCLRQHGQIPKSEEDQLAMIEHVLKKNPALKGKIKI